MRQALIMLFGIIILMTSPTSFAFVCGDVNETGSLNLLDVSYIISFLYRHGPAPDCGISYVGVCGDVNGTGNLNLLDVSYIISFLYRHGPAPICPNQVPAVTTSDVSEITVSTAKCGGTVISDAGTTVIARGVCWSTNPTPTVTDNKTTDGDGTGSFVSSIAGLYSSTPYYVRAYATNNVGTGYGESKPFATEYEEPTGTVTDIDGNTYATVKIGNQWWMAENLKVTHYRNGEDIPTETDGAAWDGLTTGAYCEYFNDMSFVTTYGRLYNWYATTDSRNIAPEGWHVPSDAEWKELEMYLGLSQSEADATLYRGTDEGGKLKEAGTLYWTAPNVGATNESGFAALPGGYRYSGGNFGDIGNWTAFWCTSEYSTNLAWHRNLDYYHAETYRYYGSKHYGFSVRCVKD